MTLVKICGIQTVEAAQWAIDANADFIGIICVPNKKRTISRDSAIRISRLLHSKKSGTPKLVGVFMNQSVDEVSRIVEKYGIDVVQLHGDEDWREYYGVLQRPIIKKVVFPRDCSKLKQQMFSGKCIPLLETYNGGGTGEQLDWVSLRKWCNENEGSVKFFLAGGLTPENVAEAVRIPGVLGVDVSSGVETDDGKKDRDKILMFIKNAKI